MRLLSEKGKIKIKDDDDGTNALSFARGFYAPRNDKTGGRLLPSHRQNRFFFGRLLPYWAGLYLPNWFFKLGNQI